MTVIMDYILSQTLKILYFVRLFNLGETIFIMCLGSFGHVVFLPVFVHGVKSVILCSTFYLSMG